MFSFDTILSKEFILQRVSQEAIFERYMGAYPVLNTRFCNTLPGRIKQDQHPDCLYYYLGNKLVFKDWAFSPPSGGSVWDCFAVVQQYYSCTYYQALQHIATDFGLYNGIIPVPATLKLDEQIPYAKTVTTRADYVPIQVKRKEWSDAELAYWQLPDQIVTIDELERNRIYPLSFAWFDGWILNNGVPFDLCFGYMLGTPDKWQIYQPLIKDKRFKFRQSSSSWVHGFSTLDPDAGYVICTKSVADRVFLTLLGFNAVNVLSESHNFSQDQIDQLNSCGRVHILYDADEVGYRMGKERSEENGWNCFYYPEEIAKDTKQACKEQGAAWVTQYINQKIR